MHIFCDLDGVIVDFEQGFKNRFSITHDSVTEPEMWRHINSADRWWHDLPLMWDAKVLWEFIAPYNPSILTGCPKSGFEAADQGKRELCRRELSETVEVITCFSRNKPLHMKQPGDILIDDLHKNIKRWNEAGGVGILHRNAYDTIKKLKVVLGHEPG
jgi:hypothetical protein